MGSSSLQDKTVRPGSFKGMYYYSDRHKMSQAALQQEATPVQPRAKRSHKKLIIALVVLLAIGWLFYKVGAGSSDDNGGKPAASVSQADSKDKTGGVSVAPSVNYCAKNSLDNFIRISIQKRHLWACEGAKKVYETAVITGLRGHPETETPVGTYKIYGKMTNTTLTGSDSRGTWKDPVYYWMPFLDNQYGTYGFHDATWRDNSVFGQISPDSEEASHGCVELPLAASKWLYEWAPVGTTVTVEG
jgi:hypothetical protein